MIRKANLHGAGIAYLRTQLGAGDYLAQALLNQPLETGEAFCFLPDSIDLARVSLKEGGVTNYDSEDDIRLPLIELAMRFLESSPQNLMMSELGISERDQICPFGCTEYSMLKCHGSRHKIYLADHSPKMTDIDSYYSLLRAVNREGVDRVLRYARPYPAVGILGRMPDWSFAGEPGAAVDPSLFEILAQQTQHILVDVFDGETYLIWSRNSVISG